MRIVRNQETLVRTVEGPRDPSEDCGGGTRDPGEKCERQETQVRTVGGHKTQVRIF